MNPKKILLYGLLLSGFASHAWARSVPELTGPVVDEAGIFDAEAKAALSSSLADYYQKTGSQYQVLTIPSLDGEVLESFSIRVANAWKIGNAKSDKGLILIFAAKDRQVRIEVGQGLEGDIPDAKAGRIIEEKMIPAFREGQYRAGILEGLRACAQAEGKDLSLPTVVSVRSGGRKWLDSDLVTTIFGIVVYGIYLFFRILFRAISWWWPFGRQRRRKRHGKRYEGFWDGIFLSGASSGGSGGSSSSGGGSWSGGGGGFSGGGASGRW